MKPTIHYFRGCNVFTVGPTLIAISRNDKAFVEIHNNNGAAVVYEASHTGKSAAPEMKPAYTCRAKFDEFDDDKIDALISWTIENRP